MLLTDADIVHDPRHVATLVAQAERDDLDLVSEMVALACDSAAEHALVPAFVFFFQLLYPFAWVNDPLRATAAAAGGTILMRRRALQRIGGIAAVRGALIDDVALAAAVKRGGRIWLGHPRWRVRCAPIRTPADIWRMVSRTAYVQLRFSPLLLLATTLAMALIFLVPPVAGAVRPRRRRAGSAGSPGARWRRPISRRCTAIGARCCGRRSCRWSPRSTWRRRSARRSNHHLGRGVAWKGRAYQGAGA